MKCRTLTVRIEQPFAAIDEAAASGFLASVKVKKVTAAVCERPEPCWSLLVLFDEETVATEPAQAQAPRSTEAQVPSRVKEPAEGAPELTEEQPEKPLTPPQQHIVASLKAWRSERAASDRVPPYCIMPNRSIEEIARLRPSTVEDLAGVSGFGPSRIEKYSADVLELVGRKNGRKKP